MRLELLIPTFRRPELIRRTLESVANAERPIRLAVDVTVINNDVAELSGLEATIASMPFRTTLLHEPRPGKSMALNTALGLSTADYIGFVDDDEELDTSWFRVVEDALEDAGLDYIGGRALPLWPCAEPTWIPRNYPAVLGIVDSGPDARPYGRAFPGILSGGNAVIARSTLRAIGPFCSALGPRAGRRLFSCEDEDIYWRLVDAGAQGRYIPNLVVYHRVHPERLQKRYYRAWCFWNGASKGVLSRRRPLPVPKIAGVPRYIYGRAFGGLVTLLRRTVAPGPAHQRLSAELPLWQLAGYLYGRHLPGAASLDRGPVTPVDEPRDRRLAITS